MVPIFVFRIYLYDRSVPQLYCIPAQIERIRQHLTSHPQTRAQGEIDSGQGAGACISAIGIACM